MTDVKKIRLLRPLGRALIVLAAAASLAGCVVYPYGPHYYRPAPYYYYR
jgi:hypothetical protein